VPAGQRCLFCPRQALHEHHVARRVHDRSLIVYLCGSCHEVVTAWMYRLRMIRREPRQDAPWQEREWAIAQGLLLLMLLSRPSQPPPIGDLSVLGQAVGAMYRESVRDHGTEPRFAPDPIRADAIAGHVLPQIYRLDPDWVELLRVIARGGARLWPEQELLFAQLEREAGRIVHAIDVLEADEISGCPPTLGAIVDGFERIALHVLVGADPSWLLGMLEQFSPDKTPVFEGLLAVAQASTPGEAQQALAAMFQRYAERLSLEPA
jgi:hypothetical protein